MITVLLLGLAITGSDTNLDMVETALTNAMIPVSEQVSAQNIESISIVVQGEHAGAWLVEQIASSVLADAGVTINTTRESEGWKLNVRPMELGVTYAQTRRGWIFGGKQIPRQATCELAATLVDPQGNVVLSFREGSVIENTASMSDIITLESSTETWANGVLSEEESGNILEPLVVTGVVTALVYLFYSSRN
jgi:hypothetical protein